MNRSEVAMKHRVRTMCRQRLVDSLQRFVMLALLVRDHAEQVQRMRMLRRLGKNAVVKRLGLVEAAGLLVLHRQRQTLRDRKHRQNSPGAARGSAPPRGHPLTRKCLE